MIDLLGRNIAGASLACLVAAMRTVEVVALLVLHLVLWILTTTHETLADLGVRVAERVHYRVNEPPF